MIWILNLVLLCLVCLIGLGVYSISMPGHNPDTLSAQPSTELKINLKSHVEMLGDTIGKRNLSQLDAYQQAERYITEQLEEAGGDVTKHPVNVRGEIIHNIETVVRESAEGNQLVVGAHYDTVNGSPGANDNGTGVAALLELAKKFRNNPPSKTIRFVAFVNEEPPHFGTETMGSYQYAKLLRDRDIPLKGMFSLETIGYYDDRPGSQNYPFPFSFFYPNRGNFLAFVGNLRSRSLVRESVATFRGSGEMLAEGAAPPSFIPGVGWSDHWSFWQFGYPAVMVTDTAPFRYPEYHQPTDRPGKIKFDRFTRVVTGLEKMFREMAS